MKELPLILYKILNYQTNTYWNEPKGKAVWKNPVKAAKSWSDHNIKTLNGNQIKFEDQNDYRVIVFQADWNGQFYKV